VTGTPTLDELLATCARDSGLRENAVVPSMATMQRALRMNPDMAAEARRRLAAIDPAVLLRDHVSRWLKATLTAALAEE